MNLDTALALFARTWRTTQRAVIKTTSFVNELAEVILAGDDRPAAIFMFTSPLNYLRGILGGPNSRLETQALAPARLRRLVRRLGGAEWRSIPCSEGEQVAMSWLSEMTALHQAMRHVRAHSAEADHTDFHRSRPPREVVVSVSG